MGSCPEKSLIAYQPIPDLPDIGAYVIWDSNVRDHSDGPARMVVVNFGNDTASFDLSDYDPKEIKRLTGVSLASTDPTTVLWAGQNYMSGSPKGNRTSDEADNGIVMVYAGEAAMVCFSDWCSQ